MIKTERKIQNRRFRAITDILGVAQTIDFQTVGRYLIDIHQATSLSGAFSAVSACFNDLLSYKLFASYCETNFKSDTFAWIDPQHCKSSIRRIMAHDFGVSDPKSIAFLNSPDAAIEEGAIQYHRDDMDVYTLSSSLFNGKIYLVTARQKLPYHNDLISIIIETLQTALGNILRIQQLKEAAALDPLTGCYNRGELERQLLRRTANASRHDQKLSVIMFDLDHFKSINDVHGHQTGDLVLKKVAHAIKNQIRTGDIIARYGGEEFIVVLPETIKEMAIELAGRLRKTISNIKISGPSGPVKVTASFGVASYVPETDLEALIKEADTMLYQAKDGGRNRVMPGLVKLCRTSHAS